MKRIVLTFLVASLDPVVAASCCGHEEKPAAATESIHQLDSVWTNQHGKQTTLADFKGRPVLITMGYSSCKFACPRLVSDLAAIEKRLTAEERRQLSVVFVSIDPARDTPGRLKEFLAQYQVDQHRWHALRGDNDAVLELSVVLGVRYLKSTASDFAHSNLITLISPTGEIVHRQEGLGADPAPLLAAFRALSSDDSATAEPALSRP